MVSSETTKPARCSARAAVIPFIKSHVELRICVSSLHGARDQDQWRSTELDVQSTSLIKTLTAPPVDTYLRMLVRHHLLKPEPQVQMGTKDTKIQAQLRTQLGSSFLAVRRYDGYSRGPSTVPRPSLSRDSSLTRGEGQHVLSSMAPPSTAVGSAEDFYFLFSCYFFQFPPHSGHSELGISSSGNIDAPNQRLTVHNGLRRSILSVVY